MSSRENIRLIVRAPLTCVDSDEPLQPPFKLKNFKCCLVGG